jgi:hypothetical protein
MKHTTEFKRSQSFLRCIMTSKINQAKLTP